MKESHPYISGAGNMVKVTSQFRKNFPATVNAETLKKLSIASNNESYVLYTLKYLRLLDEKGKKSQLAIDVFSKHNDVEFRNAFAEIVKVAYSDLFSLYAEESWELGGDQLISFFRSSDKTSEAIGQRQSSTFQALASISGKRKMVDDKGSTVSKPANKANKIAKSIKSKKSGDSTQEPVPNLEAKQAQLGTNVGLTVRVEVNLPESASQETYDYIFKSIRTNLLND